MKRILVIHLNEANTDASVTFLGQDVEILRRGCGGDPGRAGTLIAAYDGEVDAIGLEGMPADLQLAGARQQHEAGARLAQLATRTPDRKSVV